MNYRLDPSGSEIEFSIQHLIISSVKGRFLTFRAGIDSPTEDFRDAHFWCDIDAGSIHTSLTDRDNHLRGPDFFDVARHPQIKFRSTSVEVLEDSYLVKGSLEIRGTKNEVELRGEYLGPNSGNEKISFDLSGKISRSRWNLSFNLLDSPLLIGEEVTLDLYIQMVRE